ncbi:hypothetical protein CIRG_01461 [Coccidioides immitis RMSCC 2394]|uniref:Ran-specific GTPase-activating protein 30 n=1 Tax=Coccidioides immitis RMSCC 2394 TaxID=404692 RepID=A0A0J6XYG8_COCIT|nr:hypothetical protein CIRG_01461 [Coccidioides immitis RMSCC 2394]
MAGFLTMDKLLLTLTGQAMNYAVRSGIRVTGQYAISQVSRLMKRSSAIDDGHRSELQTLQERLQGKIRIISPAIDMIELIAARGNTSLESAVSLTQGIRWEIQNLGQRLAKIASTEELRRKGAISSARRTEINSDIKLIIKDIRKLLGRIEDAVPLINLAITTSGASLSTTLPATVSPSRLLQASTFLTAGDTQYAVLSSQAVQIGPTFTLSIYLLFAGHARPHDEETIRSTTWKEVIHKARLKLRRVPMELLDSHASFSIPSEDWAADERIRSNSKGDEFAYQMLIIEDLDDDRVHTFESEEEEPSQFEDVAIAGIREIIPVHQISKIFYADTGKILNIGSEGEANHPVLLLKRDIHAIPPRRMMGESATEYDEFDDEGSEGTLGHEEHESYHDTPETPGRSDMATGERWRFPPGLDLEWIAFEVYNEPEDSDSEDESSSPGPTSLPQSPSGQLNKKLSSLHIGDESSSPHSQQHMTISRSPSGVGTLNTVSNPLFKNIKTSLSLLEMLLRLTSLQQFQQQSHLSIPDELLNFFLEESSTTGAGGDEHHRQRVRAEARRKVGWDPYDESPLKRRGEDYQYRGGQDQDSWAGSPRSWRPSAEPYSPSTTPRSKEHRTSEDLYHDGFRKGMDPTSRQAMATPSPSVKARSEGRRASEIQKPRASRRMFQKESSPLRDSAHRLSGETRERKSNG